MASPQLSLGDNGPEFAPKIKRWGTQAELARHLSMTTKTARELIAKGVIEQPDGRGLYDLDACRHAYIVYLREVSAGIAGTTLSGERARLAREQADGKAMENARMRGELLERSEVVGIMQAAIGASRAALLALPSKVAPLVIGVEDLPEIQALIEEHIRGALDELSTTSIEPESGGDVDGGDDAMAAAAETDGQPVGGS